PAAGAGASLAPGAPGALSTVARDDCASGGRHCPAAGAGAALAPGKPKSQAALGGFRGRSGSATASDRAAGRGNRPLTGPGAPLAQGKPVSAATIRGYCADYCTDAYIPPPASAGTLDIRGADAC